MNGERKGGVFAYNGVLFSQKEDWYCVIYRKVSVAWDHHAEQNKPDSKDSDQVDKQDQPSHLGYSSALSFRKANSEWINGMKGGGHDYF